MYYMLLYNIEILIYPILVKDYESYEECKSILEIDKRSIDDVNIISSFDRSGNFQRKDSNSNNGDYMAVNDQNNNNVNTLDEINTSS